MNIIVVNAGSTSMKFKLFRFDEEEVLALGQVESIGTTGRYQFRGRGQDAAGDCCCRTHEDAFNLMLECMRSAGALRSIAEVDAVGYKAVHGGPITGARLVDDELLAAMESVVHFAPIHNPVYIGMMRMIRERYPEVPQVAYFETSFHATIPEYRVVYGVDYNWVKDYGIRRYGFHGSSHGFIASEMTRLEPGARRVISAHLGGSSSLCAIRNGRSIANSMGATPQSGVFHSSRVGDFDVFCLPELAKRQGFEETMDRLATSAGLLGVSGVSGDLREVLAAQEAGNERAALAVRALVDSIVGYVGMYTAYLGGLDALVFTGGIGQHSSVIRRMVCANLGYLGLGLDHARNSQGDGKISTPQSQVAVWAVETNEELMVARQAHGLLRH